MTGHVSPHPIVTTTSALWSMLSVHALGVLVCDVDALLCHRFDGDLIDLGGWLGAARVSDCCVPGQMGEEAESHLRASRVVSA